MLYTFLYSSTSDLFLVNSIIFWINKQKYMHIFSLQALFSLSSESSNDKLEISVKHLMASILELVGAKKWLIINGMSSVSKMYAKGIHDKKAWNVFRQDLTNVGLMVCGFETAYWRTHIHNSKIVAKSLVMESFNYFAYWPKRAFLLKSNTSSDKSFRIFKAFSHFD